ncbi:MAG: hypothetical protein E6J94_08885 [Methanobacteriota archaeon]|nr:MAG: hypothetical protein E6J94_08885 [Euryarchaeota archaeon]
MDFRLWLRNQRRHHIVLLFPALLTAVAGIDLLLTRARGSEIQWLAVPFLVTGATLFVWAVWPWNSAPESSKPSIATRLLKIITCQGRLVRYFPVIGTALVVGDLAYNAILSSTPALLTEDTILLFGAGVMVGYGFVPARFARERDFVLLFSFFLNVILVLPLLVARGIYANFERSVDFYSWVALAPQTGAVLNLLGISNSVHPIPGTTAPGLSFVPRNLFIEVTVVITTSCSGIYSFGIFASAFLAFVLTEYDHLTKRIWALLGLGLVTAYVANILRMVAIVLVGYYADTPGTELQNMLIAHSYAGWLIFLGWISLFWGPLLKFFPANHEQRVPDLPQGHRLANLGCRTCGRTLSPAIPAVRCDCGAYHHVHCISPMANCAECGLRVDASEARNRTPRGNAL